MNLDTRISDEGKIFNMFGSSAEKARQYIEHPGYFASDLWAMSDLDDCDEGILGAIDADNSLGPYYNRLKGMFYPYFIPESGLKPAEKAYRPFTLSEFTDKFPVGQPIKFRGKGKVKDELYLILLGFRISQCNGKTIPYIYIGYIPFTLTELFDEYEWQETDTGDWRPFGVKEE